MVRRTTLRPGRAAGSALALAAALALGLSGCAVKEAPVDERPAQSEIDESAGTGAGADDAATCDRARAATSRIQPTLDTATAILETDPLAGAAEVDALRAELEAAAAGSESGEVRALLEGAADTAEALAAVVADVESPTRLEDFTILSTELGMAGEEIAARCG